MSDAQKTEKQQQEDFKLAVMLIMKQEGVPKSKATFMAWLEGPSGLQKRLGHKEPKV